MQQKRIEWIDVAKCLCMIAIFLGHYFNVHGTYAAGYLGIFVWRWHVPCMFFLSGCTQNYAHGSIRTRIENDICGIMIPYAFFGAVALVFALFYGNYAYPYMGRLTVDYLRGTIRNTGFVTQIWFLTALFVIKVLFDGISCLCRSKGKTICLATLLWLLGDCFVYTRYGSLPYNIDLALHYLSFFILGYALFPVITVMFADPSKKVIKRAVLLVSGVYAMLVYWGKYTVAEEDGGQIRRKIAWVLSTLVLIVFICCLSECLSFSALLKRLGRQSLYLCGNEGVVNYFFTVVLGMFHIEETYSSPLAVIIMVTIRMLFISWFIYPKEVMWIAVIAQKFRRREPTKSQLQ